MSEVSGGAPSAIDAVLGRVGLQASSWADRGAADLTREERDLYRSALRRFGAGDPPTVSELGAAADARGLDGAATLDKLERLDLLRRDASGSRFTAAYPFSAEPTGHVVRFADGTRVHAMCAVDALGIPFMLDRQANVTSRDGVSGEEITVDVDPTGALRPRPADAVVSIAGRAGAGTTAESCCVYMGFFTDEHSAQRFIERHPDVTAEIVDIAHAAALGRAIFGDLLDAHPPTSTPQQQSGDRAHG